MSERSNTPHELQPYIEAMAPYQGASDELARTVRSCNDFEELAQVDGYLGQDSRHGASYLRTVDGRDVVIKVAHRPYEVDWDFNARFTGHVDDFSDAVQLGTEPLIRAKGIDKNLEQLIAVDPVQGVIVATPTPGKPIDQVPISQLLGVTNTQINQLADTLTALNSKDLNIGAYRNIRFDSKQGFSFVNYWCNSPDGDGFIEQKTHTPEALLRYIMHFERSRPWMDQYSLPQNLSNAIGLRAAAQTVLLRKMQKLAAQSHPA